MKIVTSVFRSLLIVTTLISLSLSVSAKTTAERTKTTNILTEVNASVQNQNDAQVKALVANLQEAVAKPGKPAMASSVAVDESEEDRGLIGRINWLLIIIAALLVMVIVIVVDILGTVGAIQGKPVLNWDGFNSKLLLGFGVLGLGAATWEFYAHSRLTVFGQGSASAHGPEYDSMFMTTLIITGIVFVITQALLFWYGFKYKHSNKRKALFYPDNHKIELLWTIIPAIVLTILVIRGLKTWSNMMNNKDESARVIEVFGYQFAWNARYAGEDNKLGAHDFRKIGVINALGVDTNDTKAHDDIITSEMHVEVNKPVVLKFRAKDVIHSAYLPHFRVQMNVVPGLPTQFAFTPTLTTSEMKAKLNDPKFDYVLLCNKICGSAHYRMKMKVVVDTHEEYEKWLAEQPRLVQKNTPAPAAPAETPATSENVKPADKPLASN